MRCPWLTLCIVIAACGGSGSSSDDDGELGGHCYPNGTCNVGLSCSAGACVAIDAGMPDAMIDAPVDAVPDAAPDAAVVCNDDSAYEPNNTFQTAYDTTVAGSMTSRTITGLAICPAGDVDTYEVSIVMANTNLEVLVDFAVDGAALQASTLNSGGIAIANAAPVTGMPQRIRAYTSNLPTGTYYVDVRGPTSGIGNYTLTLNVTGP